MVDHEVAWGEVRRRHREKGRPLPREEAAGMLADVQFRDLCQFRLYLVVLLMIGVVWAILVRLPVVDIGRALVSSV